MTLSGSFNIDFNPDASAIKFPFSDLIPIPDEIKNFKQNARKNVPWIVGKIQNFDPQVKDLKMYKDGNEVETTGRDHLNSKLQNFKRTIEDPKLKMLIDFLDNGIPLVPFPAVERCLGLSSKDSSMKILDGYAIMAYDFNVERSDTDCLFNMKESLSKKSSVWQRMRESKPKEAVSETCRRSGSKL